MSALLKNLKPVLVGTSLVAAAGALFACPTASLADPFKLGAEANQYIESGGGSYGYPAPVAVPVQRPPMNAGVQQNQMPQLQQRAPISAPIQQRPPIQANIQQKVVLPPDFLGSWAVSGQRQKVDAQPEFQAAAENAFAMQTNNVWNISGNPQAGYTLADPQSGVSTQLWVDKVQGGTAFIRYQHPVNNTMAQEAIVMSLVPGGAQFNGLERISIVKQNQPPRAKVTYGLIGRRQR